MSHGDAPTTTSDVKIVGRISLKQTWAGGLKYLLALLQDGNAEGKAYARKELARMAEIADMYVAEHPEMA